MSMAEQKYTRCPGCKTIFRITPQQLAMRAGQVRCGHCQTVFDGIAKLVSLAPMPHEKQDLHEAALGPATVTLRSAQALQPAPEDAANAAEQPAAQTARTEPEEPQQEHAEPAERPEDREIAYATRFAWQEKKQRRRLPGWFYGMSLPVLLLLLAAQALFHFRDAIAAHWPVTKPALARLCAFARCEVRPMQDISGLSIEASDLQADPAHRGLLILTSTIRNRAPFALAYPYVELSLSDTQEHVVVRRAFAPEEYLSGAADPASGLAANSELAVRLFIDASATSQAGYQLYLFYP
jgi:predicted Zn finger-like uncharacterized protein